MKADRRTFLSAVVAAPFAGKAAATQTVEAGQALTLFGYPVVTTDPPGTIYFSDWSEWAGVEELQP